MQNTEGNNEDTFVIEVCQDCKSHQVNTWHDEAKYQEFYNRGKCLRCVVLLSRRRKGLLWPSRLCAATHSFSIVASVECHRRAYTKRNHHEKPDSKVIPAS